MRSILRGSVASKAIKARAVDLVQNTIGVTSVVDELAVIKDAKVIQAKPAGYLVSILQCGVPSSPWSISSARWRWAECRTVRM